ncbi:MAG: ATPase, T2SS/T4P/T4SS family [Candidatus Omnitrophica bacterium]|nr:ATPase, T2SS/T4P/T4SS family [Candidatus Omnitrophota bacterium]
MSRLRLGEILIQQGLITQAQLDQVIIAQKQKRGRIGELLIELGITKEIDIVIALAKQFSIPYISRESGLLKPQNSDLLNLIPKDFAQKNFVLPLSLNKNVLTCALYDPLDLLLIDNLRKITGYDINLVLATKRDIAQANEEWHSKEGLSSLSEAVQDTYEVTPKEELQSERRKDETELSIEKLIERAGEAPVIKLVDLIIRQAIDQRASDIHIESYKDKIALRYRVDGSLYELPPPARHLLLPIVSRIKILAKMDIAEKRLPQDGAISAKLEDRTVDLRISIIPTVWGEKVVMRILDKGAIDLDLSALGFEPNQLEAIRKAANSPFGLIFVTGPTGSGKSTTLYSCLKEVTDSTKNIMTAEDPVEYRLDGINQVHVKPDIGLTFAAALRSFLRQDPDIVMVGEVRDLETAQICVRAALTGHLVFSTLHTNDAASAITRLIDIGIPSYLLTPSLTLIIAQRLARKLCPICKEACEPSAEQMGKLQIKSDLVYRPKGCEKCNQTGYKGRLVVSEVLVIDDNIRRIIGENASYLEIKEAAAKNGMSTLLETGIKKIEDGITSIEEVLSATLL